MEIFPFRIDQFLVDPLRCPGFRVGHDPVDDPEHICLKGGAPVCEFAKLMDL